MAAFTWTRITMDRLLHPLIGYIGAEFTNVRVILAGHDPSAHIDRWIDVRLVSDEPDSLAAFASLRRYTVRVRYIQRIGGQPSTTALEGLLDQVERLKRVLVNNHNHGGEGYWLDGQIGLVSHLPDFADLADEEARAPYVGAEIEWTCMINEVIS